MDNNNKLQLFNNSEFGNLEILIIDGQEYFPATECAAKLGYVNPRDAILRHCKRGVVKHEGDSFTTNQYEVTSSQLTEKNYLSESNLMRLIVKSKLPSAQKFESWIFDEVLPQIRKTGMYIPDEVKLQILDLQSQVIEAKKKNLLLESSKTEDTRFLVDEINSLKLQNSQLSRTVQTGDFRITSKMPYGEVKKDIKAFLLDFTREISDATVECNYMYDTYCRSRRYADHLPSMIIFEQVLSERSMFKFTRDGIEYWNNIRIVNPEKIRMKSRRL